MTAASLWCFLLATYHAALGYMCPEKGLVQKYKVLSLWGASGFKELVSGRAWMQSPLSKPPEHVYTQAGCVGSGRENSWFSWEAPLFQQPMVSQCLAVPCVSPISLTWSNDPEGRGVI